MMHALLQRMRISPATSSAERSTRGRTIVHEEPGSGAGAVLFRPYRVTTFVPEAEPDGGMPPSSEERHAPNPVAEDWRRASPEVFLAVARRFCARAPKMAEELRAACLQRDRERLEYLAGKLKPTLSLFDMNAAEAAGRVQAAAAGTRLADLAHEVLALEHEIWRVVAAWETAAAAGGHPAAGDRP